tara:strand:+ start:104 stop:832 length:729 start_codon:yes stop_codon:yes gene_type:complete
MLTADSRSEIDRYRHPLRSLFSTSLTLKGGTRLFQPGSRSDQLFLVIDGFVLTTRRSNKHQRLVDIRLAGELVDPLSALVQQEQSGLETVGKTTVATIRKDQLQGLMEDDPTLTIKLWRESEILAARYRQWFAKLTMARAMERLGYFLCDLLHRLRLVDKVSRDSFSFPLTRAQTAQLCALSEVHLCRCIADLHEAGVIHWRARRIRILDEPRLCRLGRWQTSGEFIENRLMTVTEPSIADP